MEAALCQQFTWVCRIFSSCNFSWLRQNWFLTFHQMEKSWCYWCESLLLIPVWFWMVLAKKKKINLNAVLIPWHTAALTLPPHGGWQEVFEKVNPSSSNPLWVAAFLFIPVRSCTMPHPLIFVQHPKVWAILWNPLGYTQAHSLFLRHSGLQCFPRDLTLQSNLKWETSCFTGNP